MKGEFVSYIYFSVLSIDTRKNMEIIIGKTSGFCYGVKNAVEQTRKQLKEYLTEDKASQEIIYCLGELVHNRQVIENLEKQGMQVIEKLEDIPEPQGKKVIIRAHGVPKQIYEKAKELGISLIDLSCPNVLAIHKIAQNYKKQDFYLLYVGEKTHPESIGTVSFCGENVSIIENLEQVEEAIQKLAQSGKKHLLLFAQTTFSLEKFEKIVENVQNRLKQKELEEKENENSQIEVVVKNTICNATKLRQEETEKIAKQVDAMIIIGGKNSANTKKLFDIACTYCKKAYGIESKKELLEEDVEQLKVCKTIGIMAGASTPQESVEEVVGLLESL